MAPSRPLPWLAIALAAFHSAHAFSPSRTAWRASPSSSLRMEAKGCAAKPFEKKRIALFGAGGYMGATTFGFLQRAASLYGTGISPSSSPRAICATSGGLEALNKVLGPCFKLAFAGEDLVRLVDVTDADHVAERLKTFDAAILGTTYQLEQRSVTLNTYEKNPNDKTYEMYLDEKYGAWQNNVPEDDAEIHASIFRNSVRACKEAGISHLAVVETHRTVRPADFVEILEEEGVPYTYLRTAAALKKDVSYTFEKGITSLPDVAKVPPGAELTPYDAKRAEKRPAMMREDFAALVVQSLMSLDWAQSRILEVSPNPDSTVTSAFGKKAPGNNPPRFDKEWCPNSNLLAEVLNAL